jgi:replicative DNA helicase
MQDEDWARFTAAMETMNGRDIWIVDATDLTIEQIRAVAETHKRRYPHLAMIVVDYLGLIKKPKAERNDLAIAHISRNLKTMAMRLHTPTFALSQLSRAVDSRPAGQRRPVMSDLRDSGSIEQDADSIMFLYRDEVYNPESPAAGIAEIILGKADSVPLAPLSIRSLKTALPARGSACRQRENTHSTGGSKTTKTTA